MNDSSSVKRLYLMRVASSAENTPFVCYLIQTSDGRNILIDSGLPRPSNTNPPPTGMTFGKDVVEQLAEIGVQPEDIDTLICTHFDGDHSGQLNAFPNAERIVQRTHYDYALESQRFNRTRAIWSDPAARYRFVDGDTVLLPGLELIETSGHVRGHQSVLVRLPTTGVVLLTIDAVRAAGDFRPDRAGGRMDDDAESAVASTRKLLRIAEREGANLIVFGHDGDQWQTLRLAPAYYD